MRNRLRRSTLLAIALVLAACASTQAPESVSPEAASAITAKPGWNTRNVAVAAAHPLAAEAGRQALQSGGTAVDAAVAVQMVLTLVEPQSSGIGGGAFLLHFDGRSVQAFDGRETAPAAADDRLFLDAADQPLAFAEAAIGGRAVGVPGAVRMLEMAHRQHGRLPWAQLLQPAIDLAEAGFRISPRLHAQLQADAHLRKDPVAAAYFYRPDGSPHAAGTWLRNPALADTLRRIARRGADGLHQGEVAQAIVDKVQGHPTNPGRMTLADLASYQPRQRSALCHDHTTAAPAPREWRLCGFPPPGSGALAIGQMLGMLQHTQAPRLPLRDGLPSADWLHLYTEAARLAFADRDQYVADPDFVAPPAGSWQSLLEPAYLAQRARLIGPQRMQAAPAGSPGGQLSRLGPMPAQPEHGTSHTSIVDGWGNALAMTSTIEGQFGARQMVGGFLLNNQLTDFSFAPADAQGRRIANRVEAGKRPRSSMSPTLVFDKATGQLVASVGSAGGTMIIHSTAKTLHAMLQWGLDLQQAMALPNFGVTTGPTFLEQGRFPPATVQALRDRGAQVRELPLTSGLHGLARVPGGWFGGADPRREGVVLGD